MYNLKKRVKSIGIAFKGACLLIKTEASIKIQLFNKEKKKQKKKFQHHYYYFLDYFFYFANLKVRDRSDILLLLKAGKDTADSPTETE